MSTTGQQIGYIMATTHDPTRHGPGPSLREQALEVIRQAISSGELNEGRIYSAAGLAKELGMSLSPVREAMMSLVSEGTIEAIPNRGFQLVPITEDDLEELIRIRVRLSEPAVLHLCALATGPATAMTYGGSTIAECLETLRNIAAQTLSAVNIGDRSAFFRHDRAFHRTLLRHGLGPRAAAISLQLRDQSRLTYNPATASIYDSRSAEDLVDLVDLISAGKSARATELVVDNLYFFKRDHRADAAPLSR